MIRCSTYRYQAHGGKNTLKSVEKNPLATTTPAIQEKSNPKEINVLNKYRISRIF